ncbi:MAG: hypothetical protein COA79_00520 [Planctomycetota bacterium]|nr:MAG: hypothetical protein COA79_00520 [Planctomycetota bacterium]
MLKLNLLVIVLLLFLTSCKNNQQLEKNISKEVLKKVDFRDVDWDFSNKNNDIMMNIKLQIDYTLTKKNFHESFQQHIKNLNLMKRYKNEEEFKKHYQINKFKLLFLIIQDELLYQEGLRDEKIKIEQLEVERIFSNHKDRIFKQTKLTFDQYLKSNNKSQKDYLEEIKKKEYIKKVEGINILRFVNRPTPKEIRKFYNALEHTKQYHEKFRAVYLLEYPKDKSEIEIEADIVSIKNLIDFQKMVKQKSIHDSKRLNGKLKDIPLVMSLKNKKKQSKIIQLLLDKTWEIELKKATFQIIENRNLVIWAEKEFNRIKPMDQKAHSNFANIIYAKEKESMKIKFIQKIAEGTSFNIKIKGQLQAVDLPYFIKKSFEVLKDMMLTNASAPKK